MLPPDSPGSLDELASELENFQDIARYIVPRSGEIPQLDGIDIYGGILPLDGVVGGDHIIYVDFKRRYDISARIAQAKAAGRDDVVENLLHSQKRAGIAVIDVSGHQRTDAMLAAMLHQAFLVGAIYELDMFGMITNRLFENLNTRFYNSSSGGKYISMIYGEILEDGTFRFLSAAHPPPLVFSNRHNRFMEVSRDLCMSFPPLGTLPSEEVIDRRTTKSILGFKEEYVLNTWELMGAGDILLLYTDGLLDHEGDSGAYFPERLETVLREVKELEAQEIFETIKADVLAFGKPADDISMVVIKRT